MDDINDLLVVIIDYRLLGVGLESITDDICVFCSVFLSMCRNKRLSIVVSFRDSFQQVYESSYSITEDSEGDFSRIKKAIDKYSARKDQNHDDEVSYCVPALISSILYINRILNDKFAPKFDARILFINCSKDNSQHHIDMINSVYCAKKHSIMIDSCHIGKYGSVFYKQAAYLTEGLYVHIDDPNNILSALLSSYLVNSSSRRFINVKRQEELEFFPTCYCHRETIRIGYLCFVCISVFCKFIPVCPVCRTKFEIDRPKRVK